MLEQLAEIAGERFVERADDIIALIAVITLVTVVALTEPFVIGRRLRR